LNTNSICQRIEALRERQDFGALIDQSFTGFGDHLLEKLDRSPIESFGDSLFGEINSLLFEQFDDGVREFLFCCSSSRRRWPRAGTGR